MLDDPIGQSAFEPNVASHFFGFDPLVLQDFLTFGLKLAVKRRILQQISGKCWFFLVRHNANVYAVESLCGDLFPDNS